MCYFVLSMLPFLPLLAGIVSFIALIHLGENKPKTHALMLDFQAIVWLLFGVAMTILTYSIPSAIDYDISGGFNLKLDAVANVSAYACIALPLISLVIYDLMVSYKRNHPEEYKRNIQPVFVIGLPFDHDDQESDNPENSSTKVENDEHVDQSVEQPVPKVESHQAEENV